MQTGVSCFREEWAQRLAAARPFADFAALTRIGLPRLVAQGLGAGEAPAPVHQAQGQQHERQGQGPGHARTVSPRLGEVHWELPRHHAPLPSPSGAIAG